MSDFPVGIPVEILDRFEQGPGKDLMHPCFLETGTHAGWTVDRVLDRLFYHQILSVELSDLHYGRAASRFAQHKQVHLYHGSSRQLMGRMVADLIGPALIWLDAHYSAGDTASDGPGLECPVREELAAIKASGQTYHTIAIDDMRDFLGGVYPSHDELRELLLDINPAYKITMLPLRHGVMLAEPMD